MYARDIINNSATPIDYNLRVGENDIKSGYGQVDRDGKMQGLGREVFDYIYEGQFKDNMFHGWGRMISEKGVFWGFFERGVRNGRGTYINA